MGRDSSNDEEDDIADIFPELIGWYKVDEGSGTTLFNSANPTDPADKLPDLTLTAVDLDDFWGRLSGFGSGFENGDYPAVGTRASYYNATSFYTSTVNDSIACFWRIDGWNSNHYPQLFHLTDGDKFYQRCDLYLSVYGPLSRIDLNCYLNGESHGAFTGSAPTLTYPTDKERWMFTFSITEDGLWKVMTVRDTGILSTGAQTNSIGTQVGRNITWVRLFYGYNSANAEYFHFQGQIADAMYWTQKQLTISEYAQVYDLLRSRYGMAARNGWG
jgi:hypothetical protein